MSERKQQIARHFGAAAPTYDRAARIQARIAVELADVIAAIVQPSLMLEFGIRPTLLSRLFPTAAPGCFFRFPCAGVIGDR